MPKAFNKYICKACENDTRFMEHPVWSDKFKSYFCNLECFNKYKKQGM